MFIRDVIRDRESMAATPKHYPLPTGRGSAPLASSPTC